MSKYSYEFKKQVVNAYLNGKGGYTYLANKFGIPSDNKVKLWVDNYTAFGDEGLKRSRKKDFYSFEKKLSTILQRPVFLINSRLGLFTAAA